MGTTTGRTRRLRVEVTPTRGWLHPLDRALRDAPDVELDVFHGVRWLTDNVVVSLAEVTGPRDAIDAICKMTDEVVSHSVSPLAHGWLVFARLEATPVVERVLQLRREVETVADPPFEWTEGGGFRLDVVAPVEPIRAAADRLGEDVDVSVTPLDAASADALPPEHRGVLEAAVALGYYGENRAASLGDVAAAVEASPETAERQLREAESRLFESVVGDC